MNGKKGRNLHGKEPMLGFLAPFDPMKYWKRGRTVVQPQQQDQYRAGWLRIPARWERLKEMNL